MDTNPDDVRALLAHVSTMFDQQGDQLLLERLGIGMTQYKVLTVIDDVPLPTQRSIANRLQVTEAGISRQIKLLTQKQYIERGTNPRNRREQMVRLTAKGSRIVTAARELLDHHSRRVLSGIDEKQYKILVSQLGIVHTALCAADDCNHK